MCHGKPTICGLRHPVENLLELLTSGMTINEIVADHPEFERDDLLAALEHAALAVGGPLVDAARRPLSRTTEACARSATEGSGPQPDVPAVS